MNPTYTQAEFASPFNYQKIATQGTADVSISAFGTTTFTIPHELGYVPTARVWFEPVASNGSTDAPTGEVWPLTSYEYGDILNPVVTFFLETGGYAYLDTVNLYIVLSDNSGSATSIPVYYRIYYDA